MLDLYPLKFYWNSTGVWPNIAIKLTHLSKRKKRLINFFNSRPTVILAKLLTLEFLKKLRESGSVG
jgi:hypothetical protein